MNSEQLTCEQCRQLHAKLFPLANYLCRVKKRMEKRGFPTADPLYVRTKEAYDAVCCLQMELHYMSCQTGVGRAPRK